MGLPDGEKLLTINQPDREVVDNQRKKAAVIDVAIPTDSKKEDWTFEKNQGLRKVLKKEGVEDEGNSCPRSN